MSTNAIITDKDGGLQTELRSPKGDLPVFLSASGDRTYWTESIPTTGASGDQTIHTPASGKKFYISTLVLLASGNNTFILKSGTTSISGQMFRNTSTDLIVTHADGSELRGAAIDDAFIINANSATNYGGWVTGFDE